MIQLEFAGFLGYAVYIDTAKSYAQKSSKASEGIRSQAIEASSETSSKCFMFMYFLLLHCVPATWRRRAQTSIRAELPSGKLPTSRVRRRISRFSRPMTSLGTDTSSVFAGKIAVGQCSFNAILYLLGASFGFMDCSPSTTTLAFS